MSGEMRCICGKYIPLSTTAAEQKTHENTTEHWENSYNLLLAKFTTMTDEYTKKICQLNMEIGNLRKEILNLEARINKKRQKVKE